MPRVVVRKSYRCQPGKRRDVLAALQRLDAVAAEAGWPRGRYLYVETRVSGEPDLEVDFIFESYAQMEQLERRLREHMARVPRETAGSGGQEHLLEPSATRFLMLQDDVAPGASGMQTRRAGTGVGGAPLPAGELAQAASIGTAGTPASMHRGAAAPAGEVALASTVGAADTSGVPVPAASRMPSPQSSSLGATGAAAHPGSSPGAGAVPRSAVDARSGPEYRNGQAPAFTPARPPSEARTINEPPASDVDVMENDDADGSDLFEVEVPPLDPELAVLPPAERQAKQLAEARRAFQHAEATVKLVPDRRTPPPRKPAMPARQRGG